MRFPRRYWAALAIVAISHTADAQAPRAPLSLADLEKMALDRNPSLGQAKASVDAAAGRVTQAGLYPNPVVSGVGDEISSGPIVRGGEFGGAIQQRIVTAGKLGLNRKIAQQDRAISEEAA